LAAVVGPGDLVEEGFFMDSGAAGGRGYGKPSPPHPFLSVSLSG
jgi:hypothetical protein